jgi:hypothetical protein
MEQRLTRLRCHVVPPARSVLRIVVVAALAAVLVMQLVIVPRINRMFGDSKADIARHMVSTYVTLAYPAWREAHPRELCPSSLVELDEYTGWKSTHDPWGEDYAMVCAHHGFVVYSLGEDGRLGTADDVWSNR